ncbi:hypothetical protein FACS1894172_11920 [Spirochaetia bacterium]|nr:hypothetical protein FACS1894172_11920 [Spirochaetia bacterium]
MRKTLREGDAELYGSRTAEVDETGKPARFSVYSDILKTNLELMIQPFTIAETGVHWL